MKQFIQPLLSEYIMIAITGQMKTAHYSITLYPIKYVHGFITIWVIGYISGYILVAYCDPFICNQGSFNDTLRNLGKTDWYQSTTKHDNDLPCA